MIDRPDDIYFLSSVIDVVGLGKSKSEGRLVAFDAFFEFKFYNAFFHICICRSKFF